VICHRAANDGSLLVTSSERTKQSMLRPSVAAAVHLPIWRSAGSPDVSERNPFAAWGPPGIVVEFAASQLEVFGGQPQCSAHRYGRRLLVHRVREHGMPVAVVAQAMGISRQCAHRWIARFDVLATADWRIGHRVRVRCRHVRRPMSRR
jgi:hypothetical protein